MQGKAMRAVEKEIISKNKKNSAPEAAKANRGTNRRRKSDTNSAFETPLNTSSASGATNSAAEDAVATSSEDVKEKRDRKANSKSLNNEPSEEDLTPARRSKRTRKSPKRLIKCEN